MLALDGIDKVYSKGTPCEKRVFGGFSLSVPDGQFVSIVGSNGSGKTTLASLLCGSVRADAGHILIDGRDMTRVREYKRMGGIGRVFQDPAAGTCAGMTILENLAMAEFKGKPAGFHRAVDRKRREHYRALLRPLGLGLEDMLKARAGTLSGGQRQALALIMTTLAPISALILDEHTAALDPRTAEIIMRLTDETVRRMGVTTLMITHNLRYALEYGDRLLMLREGGVELDKEGDAKRALTLEAVLSHYGRLSAA